MLGSLLIVASLWGQPGCDSSGFLLDESIVRAQPVGQLLQPLAADSGTDARAAAAAPCNQPEPKLAGQTGWWRLNLAVGQPPEGLTLQIPAVATPSICVHWPQRNGYRAECTDRSQLSVTAGRYYQFSIPASLTGNQPVLIQVREALYSPLAVSVQREETAVLLEDRDAVLSGLLLGLMAAVALISSLAFAVVRRATYLYAAGFSLFGSLAWLGLSGRGLVLSGPVGGWLSSSGPLVAIELTLIFLLAYCDNYLFLRERGPVWMRTLLRWLLRAHAVVLILAATQPAFGINLVAGLGLVTALALSGSLINQSLHRSRARYLLVAFAGLVVGSGLAAVAWLVPVPDLLPAASVTFVIGLLAGPLVLTFGIYERYNRLENERDRAEEALAAQQRLSLLRASYCPVTGLPRRPRLAGLVGRLLNQANPEKVRIGVYLLHIDNLNRVRQQYGRDALEEVVGVLASRLRNGLGDEQLLGLLEDWELVVVVPTAAGGATDFRDRLYEAARNISDCMRAPMDVMGHTITLSVSVGLSIWPLHGGSFDELMRRCDSALFEAQSGGGNVFKVYDRVQHAHRTHQFRRISDLKRAMDRSELELFYQPLHDANNGRVTSMEALVRWNHPEHGLLYPGSFVPLAEDTDLILDLGYWTLHAACEDLNWLAEHGVDLPIAANVSPRQFSSRGFVGYVREVVESLAIKRGRLRLEITENSLIHNWDRTRTALTDLGKLGVPIYVDDFGVGYSSLNYVRALPIEGLKIDRSFVQNIGQTKQDEAVVNTIIRLARSLELKVVAEGVESPYQRDFLARQGCDQLQGHLYSKPLQRDELVRYLHRVASPETKTA